jgi:PAS domain-containing protein
VLVDVNYDPVPLRPRLSPLTGRDLDLSLCALRSMSPIHVQYLKNMGVAATLVASLMVGGRLWGLIACHHYRPRSLAYDRRAACELLAEAVATRIAALESFAQAQAELSVRRLEQRMVEAIHRDGDWRGALFDASQPLLQPLRAPVVATASLGRDAPGFASLARVASGLLATPLSSSPGEYLLWFRSERVHTVTWGGNPFKPMLIGNDPADLSPRRSFAQWHQLVEGTSEPSTQADRAARLIGDSVADVVLQFRSVRMLIAQDQLAQVSREVRQSEQAVVVADPEGRVLLADQAFVRMLPADRAAPRQLDELTALVDDPASARKGLRALLDQRRAWRGEVRLEAGPGRWHPLLVRADPVFASPDRVLGFVLLFADLSERREAEAARQRFQEGILERRRTVGLRLDSKADLVYRNLLSSLVDNAQLAALEITDSVDLARMPELLESVRVSVARTAELLEQLLRHADGGRR